jgi:hypothetical protein
MRGTACRSRAGAQVAQPLPSSMGIGGFWRKRRRCRSRAAPPSNAIADFGITPTAGRATGGKRAVGSQGRRKRVNVVQVLAIDANESFKRVMPRGGALLPTMAALIAVAVI